MVGTVGTETHAYPDRALDGIPGQHCVLFLGKEEKKGEEKGVCTLFFCF